MGRLDDLECPYCGAGNEVNHDDGAGYEEDRPHEMTCYECEKAFIFWTSISFHYSPQKADCLNGAAHDYQPTNTYPPEYATVRCKVCEHTDRDATDRLRAERQGRPHPPATDAGDKRRERK